MYLYLSLSPSIATTIENYMGSNIETIHEPTYKSNKKIKKRCYRAFAIGKIHILIVNQKSFRILGSPITFCRQYNISLRNILFQFGSCVFSIEIVYSLFVKQALLGLLKVICIQNIFKNAMILMKK